MKKIISSLAVSVLFILQPIASFAEATEWEPNRNLKILNNLPDRLLELTDYGNELLTEIADSTGNVQVSDTSESMSGSQRVSIEILNTSGLSGSSGGFQAVASEDPATSQVIQPLSTGFRILSILQNSNAVNDQSFRMHIPEDATLEDVNGAIRVIQGSQILGFLEAPWAVDASGQTLPTTFSVQGDVVTQHVETNADSQFPIVADPNWGYLYRYDLSVTPKVAWNKVHNCFRCDFPVSGAPTIFPSYGDLLPLTVNFMGIKFNMECRMGAISVATNRYTWQFNATKNHLDGVGSKIVFEFTYIGGVSSLVVNANIVNDIFPSNDIYKKMADDNWAKFAANISW